MLIAYAKGARTFERHIDIDADGIPVSPYCSQPRADRHVVQGVPEGEGDVRQQRRRRSASRRSRRSQYLDALVRGVYAKRDLPEGYVLTHETIEEDVYLAIPLLKGQISCRELMSGEMLLAPAAKDQPITIDAIDSPYAYNDRTEEADLRSGALTGRHPDGTSSVGCFALQVCPLDSARSLATCGVNGAALRPALVLCSIRSNQDISFMTITSRSRTTTLNRGIIVAPERERD